MISILTPTQNRREVFKLCEMWMQNQTFSDPVQWIIVDDGEEKIDMPKVKNWHIDIINRKPSPDNSHADNLLAGLEALRYNKVVMLEDDDYNSPNYLQLCSDKLDNCDIVGPDNIVKYSIKHRCYTKKAYGPSVGTGIMAGTAFKGYKAVEYLQKICNEADPKNYNQLLDQKFWGCFAAEVKGWYKNEGDVINIKGHVDNGITERHYKPFGKPDPKAEYFKSVVGKDFKYYIPYFNKGIKK